jgi:hypothetical protein
MTNVFTDAGKVAGFIIQRGCVGFEVYAGSSSFFRRRHQPSRPPLAKIRPERKFIPRL